MKEIRFEEAIKRLEEIVNRLEAGDIPLDDSIKLFEEGVKLYQICLKRLDEAEKKVEILLKDKNGIRLLKPFELKESE
ncbi:MAG: exodeoxyribonuclease VII small subunit [Nitrospirota bacterium]|nr:exodeoxyribonuclease VII small subunit [Nitrospirota bacterium]